MRGWQLVLWILALVGQFACGGCDAESGLPLPARDSGSTETGGLTLVARFVHVTDSHVVDSLSPARFAGAHAIVSTAWRPHEAYSTQLLDGVIRTANRIHASGRTIDFLLHTGDACDNAQANELRWFIGVMDGDRVDPLSGPDDRPPQTRPDNTLDPYAPFQAQGLYRNSWHGDRPSIPWFMLLGNHEVCSMGVFPIVESSNGHRIAPLPLDGRPGWVLPVRLDPAGSLAYGNVTPADPGPPCLFEVPRYVEPNPQRAFFSKPEFVQAMSSTVTQPKGHGLDDSPNGATWYSVNPVPGVRLIGLDTTDTVQQIAGRIYSEGTLTRAQLAFLRDELAAAGARGELVIVATHHPSTALSPISGSEVSPEEFRGVLNEFPNVVLHMAGHRHRNRVTDQGNYLEIETCSTLDLPQEGRLIEIWQDSTDGSLIVAYEMFSHLDEDLPVLGDDPLEQLRRQAQAIAQDGDNATARAKLADPGGEDPWGEPADRSGRVVIERGSPISHLSP